MRKRKDIWQWYEYPKDETKDKSSVHMQKDMTNLIFRYKNNKNYDRHSRNESEGKFIDTSDGPT